MRYLWLSFGFIALALGMAGAVLPLLPTTPFILLAAFCFARSSRRFHNWLLNHRTFGPMIENWRQEGAILGGGNELWTYGDGGNGYVYLSPEEGFLPGEYSIEVWVNGSLMTRANVLVSSQAAR